MNRLKEQHLKALKESEYYGFNVLHDHVQLIDTKEAAERARIVTQSTAIRFYIWMQENNYTLDTRTPENLFKQFNNRK